MQKRDYDIPSVNGRDVLHCIEWLPEGAPVCALQLVHGMAEHIGRYEWTAEKLCEAGIAVFGHDMLGHGATAKNESDYGYIDASTGSDDLINDIENVRADFAKRYPRLKQFLLGHSMGSICANKYITIYGNKLSGVVLTGACYQPAFLAYSAKILAYCIRFFCGAKHKSKLLNDLSFGSYAKHFPGRTSEFAWLTKDEQIVKQHDADALSTFMFTSSGFVTLAKLLIYLRSGRFGSVPKELPILLASGDDDPAGDFGKAPTELKSEYEKVGIRDVEMILYKGDRHEILNELDREKVISDIIKWIKGRV